MEGKPLSECVRDTWESGYLSDVTFIVGEEEVQVKAHKLVLMCKSPVFRRQFENEDKWKGGDVTVPDIDVHTFRNFMGYLYTEKVLLNLQNVEGILYAAEKYTISPLKNMCHEFLNIHIDTKSAVRYLDLSYKFDLSRLRSICQYILCFCGEEMLNSDDILSLPRSDLLGILRFDGLKCPESVVYEAVVRWGRSECKTKRLRDTDDAVRKEMGTLFQAVRFPIMNKAYFADNVSQSNVLSANEKIEVFQSHNASCSKPSTLFPSKPRNQPLVKPNHALSPTETMIPQNENYGSTIGRCLRHIYKNKYHCEDIPCGSYNVTAHRYVLSLKCPAILSEKNKHPDRQTMDFLLSYIYFGKISLTPANVCDVIGAARTYQLDILFDSCRRYMKQSLSDAVVFRYYDTALWLRLEEERQLCYKRVMSNPRNILSSKEFQNANVNVVIEILQSDSLHMPEEEIYEFAVRWSSCRQEVLSFEHIQQHIRFPIMKTDFLLETVSPQQVVSQDYVNKIVRERVSGKQTSFLESGKHRSPVGCYDNFTHATTKGDGPDIASDELSFSHTKPLHTYESGNGQKDQFPSVIKCSSEGKYQTSAISISVPGYTGKPIHNVDTVLAFCLRDGDMPCQEHVVMRCQVNQISASPQLITLSRYFMTSQISTCHATVILLKTNTRPEQIIQCRVDFPDRCSIVPSEQNCITMKAIEHRIKEQEDVKRPIAALESLRRNLRESTRYKPILYCKQCFGFCLQLSTSRPVDNADVVLEIIHTDDSTTTYAVTEDMLRTIRSGQKCEVITKHVEFLSGEGRLYFNSPILRKFCFSMTLTYKDLGSLTHVVSVEDSCNVEIEDV